MASIISKVTDLDKEMRLKVKQLQDEKGKLPEFLREQRKELIKKYETESKKEISSKKQEIEMMIKDAKNSAETHLKNSIEEIESYYEKYKDKWVNNIYDECIKAYLGD